MINEFRKAWYALKKLSYILNREQKRYCVLVFSMSLVAALFETLGVSVIIPVIHAVVSINELMQKSYMIPIIDFFHIETSAGAIIIVCIGVGIVYIFKNVYLVFYSWASSRFSNKIRRELSVKVLDTYMKQGYIFFVENNSSRLIRGISNDVKSVQAVVTHLFSLICKALIVTCMMGVIVVSSPIMAIWIVFLIALCFTVSQIIFRRPMCRYGEASREYAFRASQASLEAIQGSKEVLVFNRQHFFVNEYLKNMIGYNNSEVRMAVASVAPNYLIEVVCVLGLLIAVAVQIVVTDNPGSLITQMATIAVAAFRILPSLGVLLGDVNAIVFNGAGLDAAYDTLQMIMQLENEEEGDKYCKQVYSQELHLRHELVLSNISYTYPRTTKSVIDNLSMTIFKGESIGLIGSSGAGKTTLADIILGLLKPQSGEILLDGTTISNIGEAWHNIIGYVPQSIYLVDASIRENVAFGIDEEQIDDVRVWNALEMAQLKGFVEKLPNGIYTNVGEWGVQLSGGQRQRIAIARTLYNEPDVIVLDEATAALDNETENAVMESIEALQKVKTLIIVAHRLTTIKKCDAIYEIVEGGAVLRDKQEVLSKKVLEEE